MLLENADDNMARWCGDDDHTSRSQSNPRLHSAYAKKLSVQTPFEPDADEINAPRSSNPAEEDYGSITDDQNKRYEPFKYVQPHVLQNECNEMMENGIDATFVEIDAISEKIEKEKRDAEAAATAACCSIM